MYARVFSFPSTPENRPAIEAMADDLYAFTRSRTGFVSATYMVSEDERRYASVTLWRSKEEAVAAGASIREKLGTVLEGLATAPPETTINEVYEPKP
ncbi:MAG: hypothetical protein KDJ47_09615 [Hyphomicrobiaceae bacterium]|nr:hypothetical protein [Hyphomicrobiaceae bacterium]